MAINAGVNMWVVFGNDHNYQKKKKKKNQHQQPCGRLGNDVTMIKIDILYEDDARYDFMLFLTLFIWLEMCYTRPTLYKCRKNRIKCINDMRRCLIFRERKKTLRNHN